MSSERMGTTGSYVISESRGRQEGIDLQSGGYQLLFKPVVLYHLLSIPAFLN